MKKNNVLITGATGKVGYQLLQKLKNSNEVNIYAAGRNIEKMQAVIDDEEIRYVRHDFKDKSTYESSLENIDVVFLIRPPAISKVKKYIKPFLEKIKEKEIKKVIFLSLQGADKNIIVPHHRVEKYIENLEIPYTFLRPSFFMQNLSTTHKKEIKDNNEIFIPAGNGKTNFIDIRDIAEVGKKVILEEGHINKAYELTGPENLNYYEIAEIMSEVLGKDIIYKDPSIFKFFKRKRDEGYTIMHTIVMIGLYSASKYGSVAKKTDNLKRLISSDPINFRQFVKDHKEIWL